ncbi:BlaI/MecI/CopY family transcriptional regulator, partial [Streptomyces sp. NPDC051219]|uniref:BlaI/MecI/CopY family transcriptional regulator n=1 Tax=Streptomyces sp. NPDC051219 TaxID=3155283 RepID=UPI00343F47EF
QPLPLHAALPNSHPALAQDPARVVTLLKRVGCGASPATHSPDDSGVVPQKQPPAAEAVGTVKRPAVPRARVPKGGAGAGRAKKSGKAAKAAGNGLPTLRTLVTGHLADQHEPRSVSEVTAALTTAHPERTLSATVVRNTLENLVAKGQAERTKQGSSVYYTALRPRPAAEAHPDSEAGDAQDA